VLRIILLVMAAAITPNSVNTQPLRAEDFVLTAAPKGHYFEKILEAAVFAADGKHTVRTYDFGQHVAQNRILRMLGDAHPLINVTFTGHSKTREAQLRQIDIPLSRGLFGYRLLVIREENQHLFNGIRSLKNLTDRISVGSGVGWPDTEILHHNRFTVETGAVHNLWQMLTHQRFTAFPRSLYEVGSELIEQAALQPDVPVISEKTIMLYYPFDLFFYVAPDDHKRAAIIEQGLARIYKNGTFMKIFENDPEIQNALAEAAKFKRTIIQLENPLNSERVRAIPERYWHKFTEQSPSK